MGQSIFLLTLKVLYYDQEFRSLAEAGEFKGLSELIITTATGHV